ncbi:hypothetical protein [Cupriavidus basilensis]|uniref:hypothetical protein n=1 Tax=Cupriavidus basilensis TaxID=68895 RepID=UPI00157BB3D6|nr:hypothetical protein [Cupriavidus basilensis]NUA29717.1 hypothetical protein [Cupriavidus basilensis]
MPDQAANRSLIASLIFRMAKCARNACALSATGLLRPCTALERASLGNTPGSGAILQYRTIIAQTKMRSLQTQKTIIVVA